MVIVITDNPSTPSIVLHLEQLPDRTEKDGAWEQLDLNTEETGERGIIQGIPPVWTEPPQNTTHHSSTGKIQTSKAAGTIHEQEYKGEEEEEAGERQQELDDVLLLVRPASSTAVSVPVLGGRWSELNTLNTASFKPTALNYRGDSWTELYKYS